MEENHASETLHQCVWFDCETDPEILEDGTKKHHLVFGWAAFRKRGRSGKWSEPKWYRFTDWLDLWNWVTLKLRARSTLYVWAHNQAFDAICSHAFEALAILGFTMKDAIVDAPPFIIKYAFGTAKLVLVDTLNIWRMSLKEMGKITGLEKLEMPKVWTGGPEDDTYCQRDVEIIMRAVCEWADFLRDRDMGKFCLTVASQAMQTFRHRYLGDRILVDADPAALDIARRAYHGGRVECFYIGALQGPLFLLDVSSLYPAVMHDERFPLRLRGVCPRLSVVELSHLLTEFCVCAHATLRTQTPFAALVENGKLIFPVGEFDAYLSTPELEYAIQHEELVEIHAAAVYEVGSPFVEFVEDLYGRKVAAARDGNLVESGHFKLLLNAFSGKWGQNGVKWRSLRKAKSQAVRFVSVFDFDTKEVTRYRAFNGLVQVRETFRESTQSHPAIAAHITAHGRMRLYALIRQIAPEHRFYCDTDSVLVDEEGLKQIEHLVADEVLGGLRLVGKFSDGFIYGCKDYVLDGRRKTKGVRDQAVEIGANTYRQEKWVGFRGALANGWLDAPRTGTVVKHLRRSYDKGVVLGTGFTLPLHRG